MIFCADRDFRGPGRLLCESRSFENILAPFPRPVSHHSRHSPQSARLPCFLPYPKVSSLFLTRNSSNTNIFIRNSQNDISNLPITVISITNKLAATRNPCRGIPPLLECNHRPPLGSLQETHCPPRRCKRFRQNFSPQPSSLSNPVQSQHYSPYILSRRLSRKVQ